MYVSIESYTVTMHLQIFYQQCNIIVAFNNSTNLATDTF